MSTQIHPSVSMQTPSPPGVAGTEVDGIIYPQSDGLPIADSTRQFEWIATIKFGLDKLYADDPNVFVAGDLFWYPVRGNNKIRTAPDVMVVIGRPKGHRRSYLQFLEDDIAPQVVFEILSHSNRPGELVRKFRFYEDYGVQEYYMYDPEPGGEFTAWHREGSMLNEVDVSGGCVSPLLNVRFEMGDKLTIFDPAGEPFLSYMEVVKQRDARTREKELAVREKDDAVREKDKAVQEKDEALRRAEQLEEKLRELGIEPE